MAHGTIYEDVTETVGGTPLISLNRLAARFSDQANQFQPPHALRRCGAGIVVNLLLDNRAVHRGIGSDQPQAVDQRVWDVLAQLAHLYVNDGDRPAVRHRDARRLQHRRTARLDRETCGPVHLLLRP